MKRIILLLAITLFWNCKENTKTSPETAVKPEVKKTIQAPKALLEIAKFANLSVSDTTEFDKLLSYNQLDENGAVTNISEEEAIALYKRVMKNGTAEVLPIFEFKNSDATVIFVTGKGYMGPVWGKLLVDKASLEIQKVAFDHKSETEGYGDGITQTSFEEQFIGKTIDPTKNTFGLNQNGKQIIEGESIIDGVSGATITSEATIKLLNSGLQNHSTYLSETQKE